MAEHRPPRADHKAAAAQARRTPGEWVLVGTYRSRQAAQSVAHKVRTAWLPDYRGGIWETRTEPNEDGTTAVYARRIAAIDPQVSELVGSLREDAADLERQLARAGADALLEAAAEAERTAQNPIEQIAFGTLAARLRSMAAARKDAAMPEAGYEYGVRLSGQPDDEVDPDPNRTAALHRLAGYREADPGAVLVRRTVGPWGTAPEGSGGRG